jgi:hypothetical protein
VKTASLFILVAIMLSGCATAFVGDAKFPGGARGCYAKCAQNDMAMESFVYMGEYSTACVCGLKQARGNGSASAGALGGAVGVVMQQREHDRAAAAGAGAGVGAGMFVH